MDIGAPLIRIIVCILELPIIAICVRTKASLQEPSALNSFMLLSEGFYAAQEDQRQNGDGLRDR